MRARLALQSDTPEKPFVIHYACRDDNGSLRSLTKWLRLRIDGTFRLLVFHASVCDMYCPDCQFTYMQPGCLRAPDGVPNIVADDDGLSEWHSKGRTCARCHARITNRATYCNWCAKQVQKEERCSQVKS